MFLPALCDSCGAIFHQRAIKLGANSSVDIANVGVRPCPRCGGLGHIPDGLYKGIGNAIAVLRAREHSRADLERIAQIFRRAKEQKARHQEVVEKIHVETPSLAGIADLLPQDRSELYAFLDLLIAAVMLYLTLKAQSPAPNITIQQVINQVTIEAPQAPAVAKERKDVPTKGEQFKKQNRRIKEGERQAKRARRL